MIDEAVKSFRELHAIYVADQNPTSFKKMSGFKYEIPILKESGLGFFMYV